MTANTLQGNQKPPLGCGRAPTGRHVEVRVAGAGIQQITVEVLERLSHGDDGDGECVEAEAEPQGAAGSLPELRER